MSGQGVYGFPPPALAMVDEHAIQFSPLIPGAADLAMAEEASLERMVVAAPAGVLERRFVLAHALRLLAPGGDLTALAPKDRGGARLKRELEGFGCRVTEIAKRHHRLCQAVRPLAPLALDEAIAAGSLQFLPELGLWTQPGVFSWNRLDPGAAFLTPWVGDLAGRGADFGCGLGVLARATLAAPSVKALCLIDLDVRAVAAARRNVDDPRAVVIQADVRGLAENADAAPNLGELDFVVANPPFHEGGRENPDLGRAFIAAAARQLRKGGVCRLVANIALPYEATLATHFRDLRLLEQSGGFKAYEARR